MNLRALAQLAIDHDISVVPARMDGTKRPVGEWKQYQRRQATAEELDRWFHQEQEGIGVICGKVSGGLEMVEFEGRAIADGTYGRFQEAMLASGLADLWRRVTDGYQETTPTGGLHVFYRCETIEGNKKLARKRTNEGTQVLIETRGEGGFVVVAPTSGACHPTGKPWVKAKGSLATIADITPGERAAIFGVAASFGTDERSDQPKATQPYESSEERPGDRYNESPGVVKRTYETLREHGWSLHHTDPDGTIHLTRPGKNTREGSSATLASPKTGGKGLYVFSTSTDFDGEQYYSPYAVKTILEHGGDFTASAKAIAAEETANEPKWDVTVGEKQPEEPLSGLQPLNLTEVIEGTFADEQWLVEPILPRGRQTSIYAKGKAGKSLIGLEISCALASGRPVGQEAARPPQHVVYIDFEMTPSDLQERLLSLEYAPKHDDWQPLIEHLHYYMLQPFSPFDTREGGNELLEIVDRHDAQLVTIDTLIRSVEGEENSSDTIKNFNRYTGQRIKALGRTLLRIDHAGKDSTRGQRGSSAKRDDVDLVWRLTVEPGADEGIQNIRLLNDASRMSWVPQQVNIKRHEYPLKHEVQAEKLGDKESSAYLWLNEISHSRDMTQRETWEAVQERADRPDGIWKTHIQKAQGFRRREGR